MVLSVRRSPRPFASSIINTWLTTQAFIYSSGCRNAVWIPSFSTRFQHWLESDSLDIGSCSWFFHSIDYSASYSYVAPACPVSKLLPKTRFRGQRYVCREYRFVLVCLRMTLVSFFSQYMGTFQPQICEASDIALATGSAIARFVVIVLIGIVFIARVDTP